jgi:hypothetical protein
MVVGAIIPGNVITPVSGVGEDAFYVSSESGLSLYVKKGTHAIAVTAKNTPLVGEELKAKEKDLAAKAVARL